MWSVEHREDGCSRFLTYALEHSTPSGRMQCRSICTLQHPGVLTSAWVKLVWHPASNIPSLTLENTHTLLMMLGGYGKMKKSPTKPTTLRLTRHFTGCNSEDCYNKSLTWMGAQPPGSEPAGNSNSPLCTCPRVTVKVASGLNLSYQHVLPVGRFTDTETVSPAPSGGSTFSFLLSWNHFT